MGFFRNIFGSRKEAKPQTMDNAFSWLAVDMHNHILPGIDDGAASLSESLQLIKHLKKLGYKKAIGTPHIMRGGYDNSPATIQEALAKLNNYLEEQGEEFPIAMAAEYYLDESFPEAIKEGNLLTMGKERFVLFEMSYLIEPMQVDDVLFNLQSAGYTPLLAHPERYPYLADNRAERYRSLRDRGVYFQLNLFSLGGAYGKGAQKTAEFLIEQEMVDFVGSDLHNASQFPHFERAMRHPLFEALKSLQVAENQPRLL